MSRLTQSIVALLMAISVVFSVHPPPTSAQDMPTHYPRSEGELFALVGASGYPVYSTNHPPNGWGIHFDQGGEVNNIVGPVCLDWDPGAGMLAGIQGLDYDVYQDITEQWQRVQVYPGRSVKWGGFQISLYWFRCAPVPGTSLAGRAAPPYAAPVGQVPYDGVNIDISIDVSPDVTITAPGPGPQVAPAQPAAVVVAPVPVPGAPPGFYPPAPPVGYQPPAQVSACGNPSFELGGNWFFQGGVRWTLSGTWTIRGHPSWIVHTQRYPFDPGLPVGVFETTSSATAYCRAGTSGVAAPYPAPYQTYPSTLQPVYPASPYPAGVQAPTTSICSGRNPNTDLGGQWQFVSGQWSLAGTGTITGNACWIVHTPRYPGDPGLPVGVTETATSATAYLRP